MLVCWNQQARREDTAVFTSKLNKRQVRHLKGGVRRLGSRFFKKKKNIFVLFFDVFMFFLNCFVVLCFCFFSFFVFVFSVFSFLIGREEGGGERGFNIFCFDFSNFLFFFSFVCFVLSFDFFIFLNFLC